ncbi:MAG: hypothetical protein GWN00_22910 [Aliifodinibius sp.]|nr:hypothetical protein [Fodinibius sp.]NIY27551.1 hypothetical protein [Fodinibius sp.]
MDKESEVELRMKSAEDPAPEFEGEVKDGEKELEVKIDDVPNSSGEKEVDGEAIVKKYQAEAGIIEKSDEDGDEEGDDIPDEFTNVCLEQGWTEDEIKEFATGLDDETLLALIPALKDEDDSNTDDKQIDSDKQKAERAKNKSDSDAKPEPQNEDIAALRKEIEELKKETQSAAELRTQKEQEAMVRTIDQVFDEASEELEIFGKTEELLRFPAGPHKGQIVPTSNEMVARREVIKIASPFIAEGMPVKEAMDIGLNYYKGKNLEVDVRRKVIKDLKKHETKLSAKRSGKETVKIYESEDERKDAVVREAARKAGVKDGFGL